jgi:hypothetical protein
MATGPKNQYNVVNPTGTGAVNYTDNHYMDGDGALYWTGMIAQRVIVKGEGLTADGGLRWSGSTTSRTLGLNTAIAATSTTPSISTKQKRSKNSPFQIPTSKTKIPTKKTSSFNETKKK